MSEDAAVERSVDTSFMSSCVQVVEWVGLLVLLLIELFIYSCSINPILHKTSKESVVA